MAWRIASTDGARPAGGEAGHQELLGHVGVGEGVELGQAGHVVEAEAGEAGLVDVGQVGAAALHQQDVDLLAEDGGAPGLDRRVPAAVEDEVGVAPEQAGRVDALAQVTASVHRSASSSSHRLLTTGPS